MNVLKKHEVPNTKGMVLYRKYEEEDAIVSEVVLGNPGPITKFAQEVEANKPKIIIMNK